MIFSVLYLLARCMLGCLMVMARHEMSKDSELLVLRHENGVQRRQVAGSATSRATGCGLRRIYAPSARLCAAVAANHRPNDSRSSAVMPGQAT